MVVINETKILKWICHKTKSENFLIGQASFDNTLNTLRIISDESRVKIKTSVIDGTHHFHMIKPKETAQVIFEFLNKLQTSPSTKLWKIKGFIWYFIKRRFGSEVPFSYFNYFIQNVNLSVKI